MEKFPAYLKLLKRKFYLIALIFVVLNCLFYLINQKNLAEFAELKLTKTFTDEIGFNELNLKSKWQDPSFIQESLQALSKSLPLESIDSKSLAKNLTFSELPEEVLASLPNLNYQIGSKILDNQLASLIDQNSKLIKEQQTRELTNLKEKLTNIEDQLETWNLELKSAEESIVINQLSEDITKLQIMAKTLAEKHPQTQEQLGKIKIKFNQIGRPMPKYQDLIAKENLIKNSTDINNELITKLKTQISEANQLRLDLEKQITLFNQPTLNLTLPKATAQKHNVFLFYASKVFLPSLAVLITIILLAYRFFCYRDPVPDTSDLKSAIKVDRIYNFPKFDTASQGSHLKRQPLNGSILLLGQNKEQKQSANNLPTVIKQNYLPVPILSNHEENQPTQNLINELAAKIMLNAKAQKKKILFFSAPEKSEEQSIVVSNLGVAMAKYSSKVLILDASFLTSELSHHFKLAKEETGFSDFLTRTTKIDLCLHSTWLDNLEIMPIGQKPEEAQKLLLQPRFTQALKTLANRFDFVLISAGSLADDISSQLIASNSELIFLVADRQSNTLAVIQQALLRLSDINLQPEALILQR